MNYQKVDQTTAAQAVSDAMTGYRDAVIQNWKSYCYEVGEMVTQQGLNGTTPLRPEDRNMLEAECIRQAIERVSDHAISTAAEKTAKWSGGVSDLNFLETVEREQAIKVAGEVRTKGAPHQHIIAGVRAAFNAIDGKPA